MTAEHDTSDNLDALLEELDKRGGPYKRGGPFYRVIASTIRQLSRDLEEARGERDDLELCRDMRRRLTVMCRKQNDALAEIVAFEVPIGVGSEVADWLKHIASRALSQTQEAR